MAIGNALKFAGKLAGRAFDKHPYGAPAVTGLGMATAYEASKDRFGFGTETDARQRTDQDEQYSKDNVRGMLDSAKVFISQGQSLPNDLRETILNIPTKSKELYGGFLSLDEDFAEEVDTLQSYARGDFKQRDDGRFVWDSLLLDRGETPEQYVLESYPHKVEN